MHVLASTQVLTRQQKNHSECISFLLQKQYTFERLIVSTRLEGTLENKNKNVNYKTLPTHELDAIRGNDLFFLNLVGFSAIHQECREVEGRNEIKSLLIAVTNLFIDNSSFAAKIELACFRQKQS